MMEEDGAEIERETDLDRTAFARIGRDRYRTEVAVRGHPIVIDEPPELGGGDSGPTPFDLLCAALGACTAITLRMYADRKKWPVEEVLTSVEYQRVGAEGTKERPAGDYFRMTVGLVGPLDEAQRSRLLEIANRCPVHRMLVAGATIETMPA